MRSIVNPDTFALATLVGYAVGALILILRQVFDGPDGWRVWVLHIIARLYGPLMFGLRVDQRAPQSCQGGALILANHRGPVDPLFIFATNAFRRDGYKVRVVEFMTAREYCELRGPLGWIVKNMRVIPVNRTGTDMEAAKEALRRLKQGRIVGVFPEGRLNQGEGLLPGNPGIAWLALRGGVPVYPVFIHNAPRAGNGMVEPFYTRQKVRVTYGEEIDLSRFRKLRPTPEVLQQVTRYLMEHLAAEGQTFVQPCETLLPPINAPAAMVSGAAARAARLIEAA